MTTEQTDVTYQLIVAALAELDPAHPQEKLIAARWLRQRANALDRAAVHQMREDGHTWEAIAKVLGTTRQAAWQRYATTVSSEPDA